MEDKSQINTKKPNFFKGINRVAKAMGIEKVAEVQAQTGNGVISQEAPKLADTSMLGTVIAPEQKGVIQDVRVVTGTGESDETQSMPPVVSPPEVPSATPLVSRAEVAPVVVGDTKEVEKPEFRISPEISGPSVTEHPVQMMEHDSASVNSIGHSLEALVLESDPLSYIKPDGSIDDLALTQAVIEYAQTPGNMHTIQEKSPVSATLLQSLENRGLLQNGEVVAACLKAITDRDNTKKTA